MAEYIIYDEVMDFFTAPAGPRRPVRMILGQETLEGLCRELGREKVIGLDVETTLATQSLCLAQVATKTFNAIVDVLAVSDLRPFFAILESRDILKIIHNARFERSVFQPLGCTIRNVFDTLEMSRRRRGRRRSGGHSLGIVCWRELNIKLDKKWQTSDWRSRPLSEAQLRYAALDAEVLLDLYEKFREE